MECPNCGERISLVSITRNWLVRNLPQNVLSFLEARKSRRDLSELRCLYSNRRAVLSTRERLVCEGSLSCKSIEDIANDMGVTRERIRQIQAKALRKLKHISRTI